MSPCALPPVCPPGTPLPSAPDPCPAWTCPDAEGLARGYVSDDDACPWPPWRPDRVWPENVVYYADGCGWAYRPVCVESDVEWHLQRHGWAYAFGWSACPDLPAPCEEFRWPECQTDPEEIPF